MHALFLLNKCAKQVKTSMQMQVVEYFVYIFFLVFMVSYIVPYLNEGVFRATLN